MIAIIAGIDDHSSWQLVETDIYHGDAEKNFAADLRCGTLIKNRLQVTGSQTSFNRKGR